MNKTIYHRHHKIPKHAGGTDDPSNLIILTVEEHAEAHRQLYEQHGRVEDYAAWQGLVKGSLSPEIISVLTSKGMRRIKDDPKWRKTQSENARKLWRKPGMREHLVEKRKEQNRAGKNPMQGKKQKRVCCIRCKLEISVNTIKAHSNSCKK